MCIDSLNTDSREGERSPLPLSLKYAPATNDQQSQFRSGQIFTAYNMGWYGTVKQKRKHVFFSLHYFTVRFFKNHMFALIATQ
jgi:hypothetical protein